MSRSTAGAQRLAAVDAIGIAGYGRPMEFRFELDPREVDAFVRPMPPRQALVYRLAVRGLCERCRGDRQFRVRTDALVARFRKELPAVLKEAAALERELAEAVAAQ